MTIQGCILGCITVESAVNDQIDVTEDPSGTPATWTTSIAAGDYFPDSGTGAEDLAATIKSAMDTRSAAAGKSWTYTVSVSSTDGLVTITASGGDFQLLTNTTSYADSVFPEMGYPTTDPTSSSSSLESTTPPDGTWYPRTCDDGEELMLDTKWRYRRLGVQQVGSTGKRVTRQWGIDKTRDLSYGPIVGPNAFSFPHQDIERALTCFENHWSLGKRLRVFTETRTITGAVNDDEIFDAVLTNDVLEPVRFQGNQELDWWELVLSFGYYES